MAGEQRKLAAILVADVVGYSKLVGSDEAGTLARLQALRADLILPIVAEHAGRLFKAVGDGFLVEFASAVQAVTAALAIQKASSALPLRIGIHVGDVVVEGDDLMGDGVNIAARVEGVAEAGGIAISRAVHEQVRDKLDVSFMDKGEVSLKNLVRPVHVFAWGGAASSARAEPAPALSLPDKPSIAVLPFQNMSGDPEQEYFADGMVEDIITALSGFKSLFVIARNSSFSYKGKSPDIRLVGRELGVRYVLEGSVRKAGQRVRITGQLINCETGAHLWADRFDSALEDIFDLQDKVTANVVAAIAPRLDHAERERARRKPVESLDAYDCFLRGMACSHEWTPEAWERARDLFYRAIELDPGFSTPFGMAARCYAARQALGSVVDAEWEKAEIRRLSSRVSAIGRDDALALCWAGYAMVYVCREYDVGAALTDQALAINPNLAAGWTNRGVISSFLGQYETAILQLTEALRLNPKDPESFRPESFIAVAHFILGRYDQALVWAARSQASQSTWMPALRVSAVANALSGNVDEARTLVARMLRQDPGMRISNLGKYLAYRDAEAIDLFARGLRIAGMPE